MSPQSVQQLPVLPCALINTTYSVYPSSCVCLVHELFAPENITHPPPPPPLPGQSTGTGNGAWKWKTGIREQKWGMGIGERGKEGIKNKEQELGTVNKCHHYLHHDPTVTSDIA